MVNKMKQAIVISDLHGLRVWKDVNIDLYDKLIFMGDYVDSFDVDDSAMINNLQEIIELKKANLDKVVLLWGNHELSYLYDDCRCSGYRMNIASLIRQLLTDNRNLFNVIYKLNDYLFSHAGVTSQWMFQNRDVFEKHFPINQEDVPIEDKIYILFNQGETRRVVTQCGRARGGWYRWGGPLWADKSETSEWMIKGYHQIVGHHPVPFINTLHKGEDCITYTDCLLTKTEFYTFQYND